MAMARREPAPQVKAIAGVDASRLVLRHFAGSLGGLLRFTECSSTGSYGARGWCTPEAVILAW